MGCAKVQQQLREAVEPKAPLAGSVESHLLDCPVCQGYQQELGAMKGALQALPLPALPDGFELGLRRQLLQEAKTNKAKPAAPAAPRFRLMVAAAAVLLVLGGGIIWWALSGGPTPVTYHRVHLAAKTTTAEEALFDLHLPEGVELVSSIGEVFGQGRVVRWRADLKPGINSFDLPLQARGAAGPLRAVVQIGDRTLDATIHLERGQASARAEQEMGKLALVMVSSMHVDRRAQ